MTVTRMIYDLRKYTQYKGKRRELATESSVCHRLKHILVPLSCIPWFAHLVLEKVK